MPLNSPYAFLSDIRAAEAQPPFAHYAELCLFDNDGPEGFFHRVRFSSSADALLAIHHAVLKHGEDVLKFWNFHLDQIWPEP